MPDPRNIVRLDGVHEQRATYKADGTTIVYDATQPGGSSAVGKAVTPTGNSIVGLCVDGDRVLGKLVGVESDGACSVQDDGYATLPGGASATLTRGGAIVGALGAASAKGFIRSAASGTAAELVKCDHCIVDAADANAVVVKLS